MYKTTRVCRFHTNPRPDYEFKSGDVVRIAGETSSCEWLGGSKE